MYTVHMFKIFKRKKDTHTQRVEEAIKTIEKRLGRALERLADR